MNKTQNPVFKKALVILMAVIMVFTYMPSMAWAEGEGSNIPATGTPNTLVFTKDLDNSVAHYYRYQADQPISLAVEVTHYYDADGNLQSIPNGATITYQWYNNNARDWNGKTATYSTTINNWRGDFGGQKVGFHVIATMSYDGASYQGTSQTYTADIGPKPIEVSLTVNNKGLVAATKDNAPAVNLAVSVEDLNDDRQFSLDEALAAAHKTYLEAEDAYDKNAEGAVTKLWNESADNTSFYVGGQAVTGGVAAYVLKAKDDIYASINQGGQDASHVYCKFDAAEKSIAPDKEFTLTLTDGNNSPLEGIQIGTWEDGAFKALEGKKTGTDGTVTLSFSTAGTYYVTAQGTMTADGKQCTLMAPICVVNCEMPHGFCGENGAPNAEWRFDLVTKTLTIKGFYITFTGSKSQNTPMPWSDYSKQVKHLVIEVNEQMAAQAPLELMSTFYDCENLESVQFPAKLNSVSTWDGGMFDGCTKLKNIIFDENCKFSLQNSMFANCTSLQKVDIPTNVKIGQNAFAGCTALEEATVGKTVYQYAFTGCTALKKVTYRDGATSFGNKVFYGNPQSDWQANCTALQEVSIPASLKTWSDAFPEEVLANVTFTGEGTKNFYFEENKSGKGYKAIYNADKTELYYINPTAEGTIVIPKEVTSLGDNVFAGRNKITKVEFEAGSQLKTIGRSCFEGCTSLQSIDLPEGLQSIGSSAFSGCTALQTVKLPSSLTSIGYKAFADCTSLQSIDLPEGLQSIGASAFANCNQITTFKLPSTLISLGAQAVQGTSVEEIVLPPSVTVLSKDQFNGCSSLKHIEIQGAVAAIPENAFKCAALKSLFLPATVGNMDAAAFSGNHFVVYFAGTTTQWRSMDANGQKCKGGVICNYQAPVTEGGKLEVKPSKLVYTDAEEMTKNSVSVTLQYPNGAAPAAGEQITADWYYTTDTPDGLKKLHPLAETDYSMDTNGLTSSFSLKEQAAAKKFGTWNYVCVVFKKTAAGKTLMFTSAPIAVTLRDASIKLTGTGSDQDPYQIKTYEDLQLVAEYVDNGENFEERYFTLENDITVAKDWTQIGSSATPFAGIFDGKNHIVTYERGAKCLFRSVGSTTIKNVQVQGEYIASAGLVDYIGSVGYGGKNAYIINCKLLSGENGSATLESGIVGSSGGVTITNCEVQSNVKVGWNADTNQPQENYYIGSIIGSGAFRIVSCKSAADVTSKGNHVGGLAGNKGYAMRACSIKNSQFTGTVDADGEYIGGIMGGGYDDQTAPNTLCVEIENCYVKADITGARAVGGIFGGEGGCDQCWDNGIGYIRNNVFYGALHLNNNRVVYDEEHQAAPADNIDGSKGAIVGFMRSLNKYNVIENNYYYITNDKNGKGIGAVEHIDTSKIRPMGLNEEEGIYYYDTSKDNLTKICNWVDREDGLNRKYSSVTKENHNRTDDPMGADKDKLAKACTEAQMKVEEAIGGEDTIVDLLNNGEGSMQNWAKGANGLELTNKAVPYELEARVTQENEFFIGDSFDKSKLKGIDFILTWSDGSTKTLTLADVEISGFDSSKQAIVYLKAIYQNVSAEFPVKIKRTAAGTKEDPATIKVNFTLLGDSVHGESSESHTLKNNGLLDWIPSKDYYDVDVNSTVWDFLKDKVTSDTVQFHAKEKTKHGTYIYSVTYGDITIGEFDNGQNSGWMYTLNGKHPLLAVNEQFLKDGDKIVFHYTDDYTVEEGSEEWNTPGGAGGVIEAVSSVTTDTKTGTTTAPTEVKVSEKTNADGTKEKVADVKVSADNQKEILKQVKEKKSNEIILVVPSKEVGDATKADVTLEKSFIDSIVKDTNAKLTIKTPFGDKTYTQDELKAMSEAATGSTVTVTIEKATEEPTDDAAAKIEKAKSIVKDLKLVARSSKTAKKNIKAVLKSDAKVNASIKELKDLGFTVKYRFYRSTKKAASYKSTVTKKTASYTNTSGKKGTKYFYKVQVRVYDENGKLVAKTALKQCKYASRTWSKAR